MTGTVLILGASGNVGRHAARAFRAAGWQVRLFDREAGNLVQDATGVDVIVNGLNPPNYDRWEVQIPRITDQVIAAAKASGATVIVPGNVYVFGDHPGVWDETTPHRASTKKGRVRIEMESAYRAAARDGVRTILLRAGDFIDPDALGTTLFGILVAGKAHKGRLTRLGGADKRHAYAYLPDVAQAMVMLAEKRAELAPFEDVPFPGHTFTPNELRDVMSRRLGRAMRVSAFPWWAVGVVRPFWRLGREIWEMRYLSDLDHSLSAAKFDRLIPGFRSTPLDQVVTAELPKGTLPSGDPARA
ncbi:NAD-dependent epimerase/dehydratase family protein [Shimia biformata]|uniref:NAD-dependent epimerase/dehydratase family protein n=1 Tax=Shimia biformata TaxID=1294299 RepID=UPI0019524565|nr:NAD-dependent epimerase/dehydratase family protein [Shimia biformata]